MRNEDAINKLGLMMEQLNEQRRGYPNISYEILDCDREIAIHIDFPTVTNQQNIILNRKLIKMIKDEIGLELKSIDLICPHENEQVQIDYVNNKWLPYPSVELVFENPDAREEDIKHYYLNLEGGEGLKLASSDDE